MTKARTLADNFAADINGITAGTGITGGGTSGTVTITNDMATTIAAKGDLVAGTADDTYAALTAGTNEQRLVADSAQAAGLKYVADTTNYAIAAKGNLLVGTAADTVAALTVGANDTVLTAASGETTGVKWATVSAGITNWTLLNAGGTALTAASTITISGISNQKQLLIGIDGASSVNASSEFSIRFNTIDTASYQHFGMYIKPGATYAATIVVPNAQNLTGVRLAGMSGNAASICSGSVSLNSANSSAEKYFTVTAAASAGGSNGQENYIAQGLFDSDASITSVSIVSSSGNFDAGTIYVYGGV